MPTHTLDHLPEGAVLHGVTAEPVDLDGRPCLRVELTDDLTFNGTWGVDFVDQPTYVELPIEFTTGRIDVALRSRLNGKGPEECRAFAGLAYRIKDGTKAFESVYLRPLNGLKVDPPGPRGQRAVQHFAYPDWPFDRLREERPGLYESAADIGPDEWIQLSVDVAADGVVVRIDDQVVLQVDQPLAEPSIGTVGLFVDIGTEAFFADLQVTPA
ncbi:hypothetical protein [Aestuariimicrobium ganziense]|uniref:hypothetical protein n=1 Tax=Aestuariimicrobium ganziense TaxID=2773677 RepID=UPI0019454360|nr:hypothetical protein [Aestuariimicrobium ganziense]